MNAVLAAELNERRAGVMFSEDRDDLRLGEARLAHMSILFGLSAGETHDFKWPGLPGQRQAPRSFFFLSAVGWPHDRNIRASSKPNLCASRYGQSYRF